MAKGAPFRIAALVLALAGISEVAQAQPADLPIPAAKPDPLPGGIKVGRAGAGRVYVDAKGHTLYGMDMRTLLRVAPDPAQYCTGDCAAQWEPLLAPAGMAVNIKFPQGFGPPRQPLPAGFVNPSAAPDWTVIQGPAGPQWVYKGWHMVFIRKGERPGSAGFDGADSFTWNTLKFVPAPPEIAAPPGVGTVLVGDDYALADSAGHVLFTGTCGTACSGWTPLAAGMASRGTGAWSIDSQGDRARWLLKGKPVYVSHEDDPLAVPAGGKVLRP